MPTDRARELFETYTRDLSGRDFQRLFTRETPDAYKFFQRGLDEDAYATLPWWKRLPLRFRQVFVAFTLRLPPARRALYVGALLIALVGVIRLFRGIAGVPVPLGTPFFQEHLPLPDGNHFPLDDAHNRTRTVGELLELLVDTKRPST